MPLGRVPNRLRPNSASLRGPCFRGARRQKEMEPPHMLARRAQLTLPPPHWASLSRCRCCSPPEQIGDEFPKNKTANGAMPRWRRPLESPHLHTGGAHRLPGGRHWARHVRRRWYHQTRPVPRPKARHPPGQLFRLCARQPLSPDQISIQNLEQISNQVPTRNPARGGRSWRPRLNNGSMW